MLKLPSEGSEETLVHLDATRAKGHLYASQRALSFLGFLQLAGVLDWLRNKFLKRQYNLKTFLCG